MRRWTSDARRSGRKAPPTLGLARGWAADGGESGPVVWVDFEGGAEAGDDATAVRDEADELEIGERCDNVDGGAEPGAEGGHECGVGGRFAGNGIGDARESETAAGERLRGGALGFDEENARAGIGVEIPCVGREAADVDHERAVAIQ